MQGNSQLGPSDMAQIQATMQAVEQACSSMQMHINPAAVEETILSLRQSPKPYQTCQFILENSQVPIARFQAAAAIRDVAIREWSFLTDEDKKSLISFCLRFVMQHANSAEGYVQAKVSAVAAQLFKRGWDLKLGQKDHSTLGFLCVERITSAMLGIAGLPQNSFMRIASTAGHDLPELLSSPAVLQNSYVTSPRSGSAAHKPVALL